MIDTQTKQIDLQELLDSLSDRAFMVQTGEEKALPLFADLHLLEKAVKDIKGEISDQAIDEAGKYDKKERPEFNGFRVSVSSRKNWKYEDTEIERLKALLKSRQDLMKKSLALNGEMFDEHGEVIPPASFTESTFIKMEVAK